MFWMLCEPLVIYEIKAILWWSFLYSTIRKDGWGMFSSFWELSFKIDHNFIEYLLSNYVKPEKVSRMDFENVHCQSHDGDCFDKIQKEFLRMNLHTMMNWLFLLSIPSWIYEGLDTFYTLIFFEFNALCNV